VWWRVAGWTVRARLQLSPRKAFEAISSASKKNKAPKDGGGDLNG
jgi:hypothetical protein